jgi:hypothetical protein
MHAAGALVNADYHFVWLAWSSAFLVPWLALYAARPLLRRRMWWASALTAPFGLTEPLFVPAYWNPPSLFDLAQRTGFDLESLIFCFAIGGLAAAGYRSLVPAPRPSPESHVSMDKHHRFHVAALASPFVAFAVLLPMPWNPIYAGIGALLTGAAATLLCRPNLTKNTLAGGLLMLLLYVVFLLGLSWLWPGYIAAVWNLSRLIPWRPAGLPVEELLFGFGFGMYWSSAYEHIAWRHSDGPAGRRSMSDTGQTLTASTAASV